jgi:hypothetical protein
MPEIDHKRFAELIKQIYEVVRELEEMFPGRPFTPDGHMVGSIGECMVADAFDLTLMPPSNEGYDAKTTDDVQVEIKATQSKQVAFRSCPQHIIVIQIKKDGSFETCYNGPGSLVWKEFEGEPMPKNGQHQISLSKIRKLNENVQDSDRIRYRE